MSPGSAEHQFVPKHIKLSDSEKKELFEKFKLDQKVLPKILKTDPALAKISVKIGDIIKIERKSQSAGNLVYYRAVIES